MKIAVTNNHLCDYGGSERYCFTIWKELTKRGHEVDIYTHYTGLVSDRMGPRVYGQRQQGKKYDMAFINHNSTIDMMDADTKILTLHGVFPTLEQPVPGATHYVSVSEEVQEHAEKLGFKSAVIRNGVDTEVFKSWQPYGDKLKTVVLLSNYAGAKEIVSEACRLSGLNLVLVGGKNGTWNVEHSINQGEMVISIGRGVLEAAACERNVIVFDWRSYINFPLGEGYFTPELAEQIKVKNFSGRYFQKEYGVRQICELFRQYDKKQGKINREYILENHDIAKIVDKYLDLVK